MILFEDGEDAVNRIPSQPCYHEDEQLIYHMNCAAEGGACVD